MGGYCNMYVDLGSMCVVAYATILKVEFCV